MERVVKISLVGDYNVGKSSLGYAYIHNLFPGHLETTIGASYLSKKIKLEDQAHNVHDYNIQIWDTAGSEKFKSLIPLYIRNAQSIFLCFENYDTRPILLNVNSIRTTNEHVPIYFVETKCDLRKTPDNPDKELLEIVNTHSADKKIHKTSAITSYGIKKLFEAAILSNYGVKVVEEEIEQPVRQNCCIIF
jgi:small GTP-binding protein